MNKEMLSKSDLRKPTGTLIDPKDGLNVMIMWIQRIYTYHTVALINHVNTQVDAMCLRDILFMPGEFHEWATEMVPADVEHIWERIQDARQSELE